MVDRLQPDSSPEPGSAAQSPGIRTPAGQLALVRSWARQSLDRDSTWAEFVTAKALTLLLAGSTTFDLQTCQSDVRQVLHGLQAFAWRLAYLDAQVNGLPQ
jgi:hypothetical protein